MGMTTPARSLPQAHAASSAVMTYVPLTGIMATSTSICSISSITSVSPEW